ncbi:muscarinic acetylcholine receptor M1-like [Amphiura filiformis]|uniref:muscarinic acetylcholine receptor M1-like n=1 Tax=Amphiura filiformis TaxID=82378 RepID=UPI003B228A92
MSVPEGDPTIWASVTTIAEYTEYIEEENISINVTNTDTEPRPFGSHSVWAAVLIILVGSTLSIFTVTANAMVFLSFYMEKQLQVVNNYFLLSLAVADIIIGGISMPLYTLYLLQEGWRLGPIVCDIWLSIDYAASNASVMNLCIICFDRYFSITKPLTYRANRTPKKAKIMIAVAWLLSIFVWIPLIIGWQFFPFVNERTVPPGDCYIQFLWDNVSLNVITILIAFYAPVSLMCTLYYRIWRETENRAKELGHLQEGSQISTNGTGKHMLSHDDSIDHVDGDRRASNSFFSRCICCAIAAIGPEDDMEDSSDVVSPQPSTNTTHTSSTKSRNGVQSHLCNSASSPKNSPRLSPPARHKRAASSGAAVPHHNNDKSFAASLYTILIKLPDENSPESEHEKLPSITLIEGAPKTDAELMHDQEGSHLVPPSGNHTTLPRARSDSVCSASHAPRRGSTTKLGAVRGGGPLSISTISMVNKMASRAKTNVVKKRKSAIIREKKAARTLCAILSAFIITWTPYSILVLLFLNPNFQNTTTNMIFNISYWLCYLNSTINPICYALCNTNFRRAFKRILTCKWKQSRYQAAHRKVRQMPSPSRQSER